MQATHYFIPNIHHLNWDYLPLNGDSHCRRFGCRHVYADHYQVTEGKQSNAPVIDYQFGSLRDDFNFGSVLLFKASALKEAAKRMKSDYDFAGFYDLRLKLSQKYSLVHINEYLYSEVENDTRKSGEKIFDYVDPKNRDRQIEMEELYRTSARDSGLSEA